MSDAQLHADICDWLRTNALGHANAKPRRRGNLGYGGPNENHDRIGVEANQTDH